MILIEEILIESAVANADFACDLDVCKGACCVEGDYGAPLEDFEIDLIVKNLDQIKPLLTPYAQEYLDDHDVYSYFDGIKTIGTPLASDGACIYLAENDGIKMCAFEIMYHRGESDYYKPLSCHLYPIRIEHNTQSGFSLMRYDEWEICDQARVRGSKESIKLVDFAKDALTRKYGKQFVERLKHAIQNNPE